MVVETGSLSVNSFLGCSGWRGSSSVIKFDIISSEYELKAEAYHSSPNSLPFIYSLLLFLSFSLFLSSEGASEADGEFFEMPAMDI